MSGWLDSWEASPLSHPCTYPYPRALPYHTFTPLHLPPDPTSASRDDDTFASAVILKAFSPLHITVHDEDESSAASGYKTPFFIPELLLSRAHIAQGQGR